MESMSAISGSVGQPSFGQSSSVNFGNSDKPNFGGTPKPNFGSEDSYTPSAKS
jgi:hypothetical protein